MTEPDRKRVPSLLENQSRGGDVNEGGINFQAEVVLSHIPRWIAREGFTAMLREGIADAEAKFFVPGRGFKKELVEVKDHSVPPAEFWAEIDRFKEVDSGSPDEFQWFTLVCANLSRDLHPLINGLRRVRDPYEFYDETSGVKDNSYQDFVQRVEASGRSKADADFLYTRVLIQPDQGMNRTHGKAVFKQSLCDHLPHYRDMPDRVLEEIYATLSTFVQHRRNRLITRKELEEKLQERIPTNLRLPTPAIRIHTSISDMESERDIDALQFSWAPFFGSEPLNYPTPEIWNEKLLGDLYETKNWILKHRQGRRIIVSGNRRLSSSLALGAVFSAVAGFSLEMLYRGDSVWATDAHANKDTPSYNLAPTGSSAELLGERLVVSVSIIRNIAKEVESDLERHGLGHMPVLHLHGQDPIVSAPQANLITGMIKQYISDALRQTGAQQVDIFFAGPSYLALFLGHRVNATAPLQCYERVAVSYYVPTCRLF